jgi:hypothetical protein
MEGAEAVSVAEWVLVYEVVGLAIVCVVFGKKDVREFLDGLVTVALWPLLPFAFMAAAYRRRRREARRQASISAKVADGTYTTAQAYQMQWMGPKP